LSGLHRALALNRHRGHRCAKNEPHLPTEQVSLLPRLQEEAGEKGGGIMSSRTETVVLTLILLVVLALAVPGCGGEEVLPPGEPSPVVEEEETLTEPSPELIFQFEYADEKVHSVALSPDGDLVAAGTYMEARLFDVSDGEHVRTIEYRHSVDDLAFSPDGAILGAGLGVYGVSLHQLPDGNELAQLHGGYNNRIAFSPDGETIATGNRSGVVWLWRIEDGDQLAEFEPPDSEWIRALAFSPDGEILAASHWDGTVYLWRVGDGRLLHTLESQTGFCKAEGLAFSPDGELLAVAGARHEWDDVVRVWRVSDGTVHQDLAMSQDAKAVAFSPDGRWLAAGSSEELTIWEMPEGSVWHTLDHVAQVEESDWITDLAFSPDSTLLAAGRWIGILELWQVTP